MLNLIYAYIYAAQQDTASLLFTYRSKPQLRLHVMNEHVNFYVGLKQVWTLMKSCDLWLHLLSAGEASLLAEARA